MADIQKFPSIDADKWSRIQAAVKSKTGIDIMTDAGIASAKGITLGWVYLPATQDLTITLSKRAFYDPSADVIDADVAALVAEA